MLHAEAALFQPNAVVGCLGEFTGRKYVHVAGHSPLLCTQDVCLGGPNQCCTKDHQRVLLYFLAALLAV